MPHFQRSFNFLFDICSCTFARVTEYWWHIFTSWEGNRRWIFRLRVL